MSHYINCWEGEWPVFWAKEKACAFTGHRPDQLPFKENSSEEAFFLRRLAQGLDQEIQAGKNTFICGMAQGVDTLLGELVVLRKKELSLTLVAARPYEGQAERWGQAQQSRYASLLAKCDYVYTLAEHYEAGVFHRRNRFMVDHAQSLLAGYNGRRGGGTSYTVHYAQKKGSTIHIVPPIMQLTFI